MRRCARRWRGTSRSFSCSIAAGSRRSCSVPPAATCASARSAPSRSRCTDTADDCAATTAATRSRCRRRARCAARRLQRLRGFGTQQLEHFVGLRVSARRASPAWTSIPPSSKWAHHRILERMAQRRRRHPARHADDREGPGLPERDGRRAWWTPTPACISPISGPASGRSSSWRRSPDAPGAVPRGAACSSRRERPTITRSGPPPPTPLSSLPPPSCRCDHLHNRHIRHERVWFGLSSPRTTMRGRADLAEKVASWLRRASRERLGDALTVLGPAPCPIMRLKGNVALARARRSRARRACSDAWCARGGRRPIATSPSIAIPFHSCDSRFIPRIISGL